MCIVRERGGRGRNRERGEKEREWGGGGGGGGECVERMPSFQQLSILVCG